jgi:hypothetical protein
VNWQRTFLVAGTWAASSLVAASCSSPTATTSTATTPISGSTTTSTASVPESTVTVALRVEDRTGTEPGFADAVARTLTDPRGWQRAGFAFTFDDPAAPYSVVLAEGPEVDALCAPYDTYGLYSCQLGPVVALNADRWRAATPEWPPEAGLDAYREMLVNHEVGHLLGLHHPDPQCPAPGAPAPVMAQQSTELPETGCLPNPWPLDHEVACAARHDEPLAPPYEPDARSTC